MIEKFILCDCKTEGILLSEDEEVNLMYLSFFQYGYNPTKMSLYLKLRYCWQVLSKGKPFNDNIILNKENSKELVKELNKFNKKPNKTDRAINLGD